MKLLLDTHIFIWLLAGDSRLPSTWKQHIRNPENQVFLSVGSVWEASIKYQIGKLKLPDSPGAYLPVQRIRHSVSSLPLDERSVSSLASLPLFHRDPFDRILICQAMTHDLTMVTVDSQILQYELNILSDG